MSYRGLCILDWNGTIQDDIHHIYECGVERIFAQFGLPCPTLDEYRNEVTADFMNSLYWARGIPRDITAKDLNAIMSEGFKEKGVSPELFPEALGVVNAIDELGYEVMVASGYDSEKLADAISNSGFASRVSFVVGSVTDKAFAIKQCIDDYEAWHNEKPKRVVKIGDTIDDALAAHEVGDVTPYICPRGFHPRARIEACRDNDVPSLVVIDSLTDLPALLA